VSLLNPLQKYIFAQIAYKLKSVFNEEPGRKEDRLKDVRVEGRVLFNTDSEDVR